MRLGARIEEVGRRVQARRVGTLTAARRAELEGQCREAQVRFYERMGLAVPEESPGCWDGMVQAIHEGRLDEIGRGAAEKLRGLMVADLAAKRQSMTGDGGGQNG